MRFIFWWANLLRFALSLLFGALSLRDPITFNEEKKKEGE
jgi:hypothetical protein